MKNFFKLFFLVVCTLVVLNTVGINKSEACISSAGNGQRLENSDFITIVRTVENGVNFICIYTDSGILLMKAEELH